MTQESEPRPEQVSPTDRVSSTDQPGTTVETEVSVRRIPRYSRFLILGAGIGAVTTFIFTASFPVDSSVGFSALFGYFLLFGIPAGALLGAVAAIVLDANLNRRAKTAFAEHTTLPASPAAAPTDWPAEPDER